MKEDELRESARCAVCKNLIGHSMVPMFTRVTVQRHVVDMQAVQRQQGLAMMLGGNGFLASHMGPGEDMAKPLGSPIAFTVCENCLTERVNLAQIIEQETDDDHENRMV